MYMQAFRCQVTGATSTVGLAAPKPAVYCGDDPSKCVKGPKQILSWNQKENNTFSMNGKPYSVDQAPGYNDKCGFHDGTLFYVSITSSAMTDNLH